MKDFGYEARLIRKLGAMDLASTMRKVAKLLAANHIPHLVCGGYVVQEHGYPRNTKDVDFIVPNRNRVKKLLLANGYMEDEGPYSFIDPETNAGIDLLLGGSRPTGREILPLPNPTRVSMEPILLTLEELVTQKLSSGRSQDQADVVALIKKNGLPRDYAVDPAVAEEYGSEWNVAQAELGAEALLGTDDEEENL